MLRVLGCPVERTLPPNLGLTQLRAGKSLIDLVDADSELGRAEDADQSGLWVDAFQDFEGLGVNGAEGGVAGEQDPSTAGRGHERGHRQR